MLNECVRVTHIQTHTHTHTHTPTHAPLLTYINLCICKQF